MLMSTGADRTAVTVAAAHAVVVGVVIAAGRVVDSALDEVTGGRGARHAIGRRQCGRIVVVRIRIGDAGQIAGRFATVLLQLAE